MPSWHRYVLLAAMALASIGIVGHVRRFMGTRTSPQSPTVTVPQNGFADSGPVTNSATTPEPNAQPWYLSPRFLSIGASVVGGFVIGWLMRIFVKTTILIGALFAATMGVLTHFHVMNVDFTSVQQQYSGDVSWLTDQASRLKDVAVAYLPVHAGGLFGMFLGFRRTRL
jgi:uncharacterized membrane protein (Fun14 family)